VRSHTLWAVDALAAQSVLTGSFKRSTAHGPVNSQGSAAKRNTSAGAFWHDSGEEVSPARPSSLSPSLVREGGSGLVRRVVGRRVRPLDLRRYRPTPPADTVTANLSRRVRLIGCLSATTRLHRLMRVTVEPAHRRVAYLKANVEGTAEYSKTLRSKAGDRSERLRAGTGPAWLPEAM